MVIKPLYYELSRKEIASVMQQQLAELMFTTLSTTPRNDDGWCERG